jgi:integrase/recombinase XerD
MSENSENKYIIEFLYYLEVEKGLSRNTILSYHYDLKLFQEYLDQKHIDILKVTYNDIIEYIMFRKLESKNKLKPRSIFRLIESLRQFYKFLVIEDKIKINPAANIILPKLPQRLPDTLTVDEMAQLITSIPEDKEFTLRYKTMIQLLYATGLRVSELINLKLSDINMDGNFIRVIGKGMKERIIPFGPRTKYLLEKYLNIRLKKYPGIKEVFVSKFRKKLSRIEFWEQLKKFIKLANINKSVSPHTIRHSFASHLLKGGADLRVLQELLGHSSITTTQIYTHIDQEHLKNVHKKYHPRG